MDDFLEMPYKPVQPHNYKLRITKKHLRWWNSGLISSFNKHEMYSTARAELTEILSFIRQLELRCAV